MCRQGYVQCIGDDMHEAFLRGRGRTCKLEEYCCGGGRRRWFEVGWVLIESNRASRKG